MTEVVVHPNVVFTAASHVGLLATQLGRWLCAIVLARATRRALNGLPDDLLRDVGLTRRDIPFVADAVACGGLRVAAMASPTPK